MAKILIAEDEVHIQRLAKVVIEKGGHIVETVGSGEDALKLLEEGHFIPDLMILDIMMPGIDGLQVLRTVKNSPKLSKIPVIMLTALAQEAVVLKGIQLGAKDYIRKPFHPTDLLDRINKQLVSSPLKAEGM
jgi:two-component system, OmpR family, alkaline phosphatase synthesis response regulator PhoP